MTHLQSLANAPDKAAVATANFEKLDTVMMTASAALNFNSISAAASEDLTIAVSGAAVNDDVSLGLPSAPDVGLIFQAWVSAADVVTVRATNVTGSPINPASATFKVRVMRQ